MGRKAQALPLGRQGRNRPHAGRGEEGVDEPEIRDGVIAKKAWRPAKYRWGPISQGGRQRTYGGPQSCIFHMVCIYVVPTLAQRQAPVLYGYLCGHCGPTPKWSGVLAWKASCSVRRAGQRLTLHSWKLGQGSRAPAPCSTPGAVPLPGRPCRALMEWAGHWDPEAGRAAAAAALHAWHLSRLLWWSGSLAPYRRVFRPPRQLNTACGLSPHGGSEFK